MIFGKNAKIAQNVVARQGIGAWQVLLVSAMMGFLSIYALTLGLYSDNLAKAWKESLTHAASIRITAERDDIDTQAAAAIEVLRSTVGVENVEEVDRDAQIALLGPWLGDEIPADVLILPRFFRVTIDPDTLDEEALLQRLGTEAPGAVWDNHTRWRGPIVESATTLRSISWISIVLIGLMYFFMIFIAAEASIAANANAIRLLRQIGASDEWTQSGFLRKFVTRGLFGALIGLGIGVLAIQIFAVPKFGQSAIFSLPAGGFWLGVFAVLVIALISSYFSTKLATRRYLERFR